MAGLFWAALGGGDTPDRVEGRQPWFHPLRRCGGGGGIRLPPPIFAIG